MNNQLQIYLAGPDVFYREVFDIAAEKKRIIHDLSNGKAIGLHPFDKEDIQAPSLLEKGRIISRENRKMMDEADMILANITPFRGANVDDGTAFEIGYMVAQGKPVYAYSNAGQGAYHDRVKEWVDVTNNAAILPADTDGYVRDHDGASIEPFGFQCNLMIGEVTEGRFAATSHPSPPTDLSAFEDMVKIICKNM